MMARGVIAALLVAVVYSAVEVARTAHRVRLLHAQLEELRMQQDEARLQHSELLLEISAVASLAQVQAVAQSRLAMEFPERLERVAP
ncbi:MAG: cell division protein FtsL [Pseudomonadota bacterium]